MRLCAAMAAAFLLDMLLGDPQRLPHLVVFIGKSITHAEAALRRLFGQSGRGLLWAGGVLALAVPLGWCAAAAALLAALRYIHPALALAAEVLVCWQCLAARSLGRAADEVEAALARGLAEARGAVARVVGRDVSRLDRAGVIRAAVETVAENCCDGVIAPLFYMAIGGAPLAVCYKAVNTLDSMVGYKNERYILFGRASARLDDIANLVPARVSAALLMAAAYIYRQDARAAVRIFRRDRFNHKSPNSAQSESVCAGALGIRLGGGAFYFGEWVEKPHIGDALRPPRPDDITKAKRMMLAASALAAALAVLIRGVAVWALL